ncbi:MAG TPA: CotH kinase family protein [Polyangia bacterium]|jgi:hypothetical protein
MKRGLVAMVGLVAGVGIGSGCGDGRSGAAAIRPGADGSGLVVGTDGGGARGSDADASPPVDTSLDGRLVINELMADNVLSARDDDGAATPWLEIYNPTSQDIALDGYGITDDFTAPGKSLLPPGVVAPAGGYLILYGDGNPTAGAKHLAVSLTPAGGQLGLARPDGSFIDRVTYGAQDTDISAAREPDGSNAWVAEWNISPGAPNPPGAGQPFGPQAAADPPETIPAAGDLSDRVLAYDLMPQFDLEISPDAIASLRAAPDTWVSAQLVYEGRSYGPVGVNLKGTSSFQPIDGKPGFRVNINKFVKGAKFFGLKEFLLNNMTTDPSMEHERLAYWIGRQIGGVPTSRSNHAWVTMNGAPLGLYATVEEPKDQLMAYYFTDATGPVYTINYADFQAAYLSDFEFQDGTADLTLISDASTALAMQPADAAVAAAAQYVNLHEFARYWALCVLVAHWGGWPYAATGEPVGGNAGTYADPTSQQLYFIPEGINEAFATSDYDFINNVRSVLAQACAASSSCFQDFSTQLNAILAQAVQLDWAGEQIRVAQQIAPFVAMDTKKPYADVADAQRQVGYFIGDRGTYVQQYLLPPGTYRPPTDGGTGTVTPDGGAPTAPDAGP